MHLCNPEYSRYKFNKLNYLGRGGMGWGWYIPVQMESQPALGRGDEPQLDRPSPVSSSVPSGPGSV